MSTVTMTESPRVPNPYPPRPKGHFLLGDFPEIRQDVLGHMERTYRD